MAWQGVRLALIPSNYQAAPWCGIARNGKSDVTGRARRVADNPGGGEIALILAAERLFAERGIEAVAMRHINQAANQRNMSAAHYHFGSRDGLIRAVLMHRWPELDRRRGDLLRRSGPGRDIRFYLEAFVEPLIEELAPREEGNFYLRFMQQYERFRGDYGFARQLSPAGVEIYDNLERLIGYLPEAVRRLRIGYLINMIHSVLAITEERLGTGEVAQADIRLIAANLVDMCAAALVAPLSAGTLDLLT
jgi:AcrR family transcriptional regulator